jgi:DNA invertase Pin-like site-specific DNA recombinase
LARGIRRGSSCRVGLYARVSTHDQHTLSLQLEALRTYALQRCWSVVTELQEVGSGAI